MIPPEPQDCLILVDLRPQPGDLLLVGHRGKRFVRNDVVTSVCLPGNQCDSRGCYDGQSAEAQLCLQARRPRQAALGSAVRCRMVRSGSFWASLRGYQVQPLVLRRGGTLPLLRLYVYVPPRPRGTRGIYREPTRSVPPPPASRCDPRSAHWRRFLSRSCSLYRSTMVR